MRRLALMMTLVLVSACSGTDAETAPGGAVADQGGGMELVSSEFTEGDAIPARFTCDGDDLSPPLRVIALPAGTEALSLIVDDPDAPAGVWDHWVAYDIPVTGDGDIDFPEGVADLGTPGRNSWGRSGYGGPCPPGGTHRYFFTVYALDTTLDLAPGAGKDAVLEAMSGHLLAEATLMGTYTR